jgi:hypothetical protein
MDFDFFKVGSLSSTPNQTHTLSLFTHNAAILPTGIPKENTSQYQRKHQAPKYKQPLLLFKHKAGPSIPSTTLAINPAFSLDDNINFPSTPSTEDQQE